MAIASAPAAAGWELTPIASDLGAARQADEVVRRAYDSRDRGMPFIKLIQPNMATKTMPPGHFIQSLKEQDLGEEVLAVVLHIFQVRSLYRGEFGSPDRELVCGSHDCVTGTGEPGGPCGDCRFARRTVTLDENGVRKVQAPACTIRHLYVIWPVAFEGGTADDAHLRALRGAGPAIFGMQRSALRNARKWDSLLADARGGEGYGIVFRLSAEEAKGRGGNVIYVPNPTVAHEIRDEDILDELRRHCHAIAQAKEQVLPPLPALDEDEEEPEPALAGR